MTELPGFTLTLAGYRGYDRYRERVVQPLLETARKNGSHISVLSGFLDKDRVRQLLLSHSLVALPYTQFSSDSGILHLAIAYGIPVVVTDVGALPEAVTTFGIGVVVPPGEPSAFAAGIRRLYTLEAADIEEGFSKAKRTLSWTQAALQTASIYKAILSNTDSIHADDD
jgi:glycosyltransferase involved in cell wall biosynthesis